MSDTPRTDDQIGYDGSTMSAIRIEFCRQLERELNAANDMFRKLNIHTLNLTDRIKRLEEVLNSLTLVVGLTPIAGNKDALQEAMDMARLELKAKEAL